MRRGIDVYGVAKRSVRCKKFKHFYWDRERISEISFTIGKKHIPYKILWEVKYNKFRLYRLNSDGTIYSSHSEKDIKEINVFMRLHKMYIDLI